MTTSADFFSTPLNSIYSVFRLFTVEGWYEIPDAIAAANNPCALRAPLHYDSL